MHLIYGMYLFIIYFTDKCSAICMLLSHSILDDLLPLKFAQGENPTRKKQIHFVHIF